MKKPSSADLAVMKVGRDVLVDELRRNEAKGFSDFTRAEADVLKAKVRNLDVLIRKLDRARLH